MQEQPSSLQPQNYSPVRRALPILFAILVLSLLWLLFFWRVFTPDANDRVIFAAGDFTQHYYAFSDYQVERLQKGEFPLWNPYNYAGDPFAGNIQFAAFYPPRYIMAALVGGDGWTIADYQLEVALHYWLASLLMFAFLNVYTRRVSVALFGSILYTYSGYLTGYPLLQVSVLESAIWLPLMMLGAHLAITRPNWSITGGLLGGVGIALSLFGGHPQTTMQITYLTIAYLVFAGYQHGLSLIQIGIRLGVLLATGAGLSMIQLLPALEFTRLSYRVTDYGYPDKANGFQFSDLFQTILPGLFGDWSPLYLGASGFLLAIGALLRPHAMRFFWLIVIVVGLWLSFGAGSIVYDLFYLIAPGFNIFRQQERIASVVIFALIMLACNQLLWLLNREQDAPLQRYQNLVFGFAGVVLLAAMLANAFSLTQGRTGDSLILANTLSFVLLNVGLFAAWFAWQQNYPGIRWHIIAPLVVLLVIDLFTIGTRSTNYVPDIPANHVQLSPPLEPYVTAATDITWRVDGAASLGGYGVYFRVPDIYGTGPFTLGSMDYLRQLPVDRFWEVLAVRYATTIDEPPAEVPLNLLAYAANYAGEEYKLLELQNPRPIAHLVYDYRQAENSAEFARQIMADSRINLREMAITLQPLPFELPVTRPEVSEITNFQTITPEHLTMTVSTGADALLTISIPKYPGWQATLNGEPVEIVNTYAGLMGIPLRAGENQTVSLEFRPQSIITGAIISGITLLLMVLASVATVVMQRRPK